MSVTVSGRAARMPPFAVYMRRRTQRKAWVGLYAASTRLCHLASPVANLWSLPSARTLFQPRWRKYRRFNKHFRQLSRSDTRSEPRPRGRQVYVDETALFTMSLHGSSADTDLRIAATPRHSSNRKSPHSSSPARFQVTRLYPLTASLLVNGATPGHTNTLITCCPWRLYTKGRRQAS